MSCRNFVFGIFLCWLLPANSFARGIEWQHFPVPHWVGQAGLEFADLDGSGGQSLVYTGFPGRPGDRYVIGVYAFGEDGTYKHVNQISMVQGWNGVSGRILVARHEGRDQIVFFTSTSSGAEMVVMGESPIRVLRRHALGLEFAPVGIGDINSDGSLEIIGFVGPYAVPPGLLAIVDFPTGNVTVHADIQIGNSAIAYKADQLSEVKLVARSVPGVVREGVSLSLEWSYADGFSGNLIEGNFDENPDTREFASMGPEARIFGSGPYQLLNSFPGGDGVLAKTIDIDSDGLDEIAYTSPSRRLVVANPRDGSVLYTLYDSNPVLGIGVGSVPGRTSPQIAYRDWRDGLTIRDSASLEPLMVEREMVGPFSTTLVGDIDGDGSAEAVFATYANGASTGNPSLQVLNLEAGEARPPAMTNVLAPVAIGLVDNFDKSGEIQPGLVLAGNMLSDGRVSLYDGRNMLLRWSVGGSAPPFSSRIVAAAVVGDVNDDGVGDVGVLVKGGVQLTLVMLDGVDGSTIWETEPRGYFNPLNMAFSKLQGKSATEVVLASGSDLTGFDAATGSEQWTTHTGSAIRSIASWNTEEGCRLGLVLAAGQTVVLDCANRDQVSSFEVPLDTVFLMAPAESDDWYIYGAGAEVYGYEPGVGHYLIADDLGSDLGIGGAQAMRNNRILVGSRSGVSLVTVWKESIFAAGFERQGEAK